MSELKQKILNSLSKKHVWIGLSILQDPYTQWFATDSFFKLWREHKDEIKELNFSLYKSKHGEWLVTLFGEELTDKTREELLKERFSTVKDNLIMELAGCRMSESLKTVVINQVKKMTTYDELQDVVWKYAEMPMQMWQSLSND